MMMKFILCFVCLLLGLPSANARSGGGHVQAFDANMFGGNWVCARTLASGTCGPGPFSAYGTAVCDGVTDDTDAFNMALGTGKLYIPPNSKCATLNFFGNLGDARPWIIWGYGATLVGSLTFGTVNNWIGAVANPAALIEDANAGATTIQLKTAGDISRFAAGTYVYVGGLENQQPQSQPANLSACEFKYITSVSSGPPATITFANQPLRNNLKSNWPLIDNGTDPSTPGPQGPAAVYNLHSEWNTNAKFFGYSADADNQVVMSGRNVVLTDINMVYHQDAMNKSPAPSLGTVWFIGGNFGVDTEIDKCIDFHMHNANVAVLLFQSGADSTLTISNSRVFSLNGTPARLVSSNNIYSDVRLGPTAYGKTTLITSDHDTIPSIDYTPVPKVKVSLLTWQGAGTFSVTTAGAVNDCNNDLTCPLTLSLGGYFYGMSDCTNNSSPHTTLHITAIRESAGTMFIDTDLGNTEPTPTCGGGACYICAGSGTITQTNKPIGSANLTQYADPP